MVYECHFRNVVKIIERPPIKEVFLIKERLYERMYIKYFVRLDED
jgi:hypothetical protein